MRTSRLAKLLESRAKEFTSEEKARFNELKKISLAKLEAAKNYNAPNIQTRALDNFDLLTKDKKQELVERYRALQDEVAPLIIYEVETNQAKYKETSFFYLTDDILNSRMVTPDPKPTLSIQQKLASILNEITSIACEAVLDGRGCVRGDVVSHFEWRAFKDELNSEFIVKSFVHTSIAMLFKEVCDPFGAEDLQKACHAMNAWFSQNYKSHTDKAVKSTQKNDFYNQFVSALLDHLITYQSGELLQFQSVLEEFVHDDFHHARHHSRLHLQRAKFWIDALHQLLFIYDKPEQFLILWSIVQTQLDACYESASVENSFAVDEDEVLLNPECADKLYLCSLSVDSKDLPQLKIETAALLDKSKKEELKRNLQMICNKRDKSIVVDEIMKEYLAKSVKPQAVEEKMEAEEKLVLQKLIANCDDKKSDTSVKEMLNIDLKKHDTSLLNNSRLFSILDRYTQLFSVVTEQDNIDDAVFISQPRLSGSIM